MENIIEILNGNLLYIVFGLLALVLVLVVLIMILFVKYSSLRDSFETFMEGRDGKSLEEIIAGVVEDNRKVKLQCKHNIDAIVEMKKGLKATYKKIGLMKYDTFRGMSGKLSFSLALLDGEDSGFVLSCMHTQDGCYSYLKEIIHGESHAILSNEEKDALNMALNYDMDHIEIEEETL
ncbi:MAG: DUF4446 family protein [Fusicatenibacter sp.]|nr:DUF4446 family protein [Fusicatenibacter sp.]